jgi:hypothetical protein
MVITVFGSSLPQPGSPAYQDAFFLGNKIAMMGHAVMNGGYLGTMEAVSRGAAEGGGEAVGVTCDEIEKWRPVRPNRWLTREVRFPTLRERLNYLACECDQAIALPGGIGTLAEISYAWNLMVVGVLETPPLWVVGKEWQSVIQTFFNELAGQIPAEQRKHVHYLMEIDKVIEQLEQI